MAIMTTDSFDQTAMKSRRILLWFAAALAMLGVLAGSYYYLYLPSGKQATVTATHALRPTDQQVLLVGARVYAQNCAACHGANGEGQPNWRERTANGLLPAPPHDRSGHTWHHADEQLFAITKQGLAKIINEPDYRTAMPVYDGVLTDDEIVAALSWIKAQWPEDIQRQHDEVNARYRKSMSP